MRRVLAVAVLVGALALAGCSAISSGTITEKHHRDGYYYTTQVCSAYDKNGACTVYVPIQNWQPPAWWFDIRYQDTEGFVYVSEDAYERYEVGDFYNGDD
jgi:uncharacterized protein YceK